MTRPLYPRAVADAFDKVASEYHQDYLSAPSAAHIREIVMALAQRAFPEGARILEVGCRSGFLTTYLAKAGFRVVAIDASHRLLDLLERQIAVEGLENRVQVRRVPELDLSQIGEVPFDGAIIPHGVMNLIPEPSDVGEALIPLLNPHAPLLADVLNRHHLFEILVYPVLGRPAKGFRKLGARIPLAVTRSASVMVPTQFYTPSEIVAVLSPHFQPQEVTGALIAMPPPSLDRYRTMLRPLREILTAIDRRICRHRPFRDLGHHFILWTERRG